MNKKIIILLVLLPFLANAQIVSDAKQWTSISINKKINNFEFSLSEELRLDENTTHIDKFFTELGVEYKITKGFYVGLNYRYSRDNDYESRNYDLKHRIDLVLKYKIDFDKFKIDFKTKIQTTPDLPYNNNPTYTRSKFRLNYKVNESISPYISYEFYYQFNDQKIVNRTRLSLGGKYAINDNNSIKLYYIFENKFNTKNLKHNHIFGVSYSIDI